MDKNHNPEFTILELYVAYKDYFWMMEMTEKLLEDLAIHVNNSDSVKVGENLINFKSPYPRIPIFDSIKTHTGIDISKMNENELRTIAKKLNVEIDETMGEGKIIDAIFGEKCEHNYIWSGTCKCLFGIK